MVLTVLTLLTPGALAFRPSDDVPAGIEPQRLLSYHPALQARLARQPGWVEFVAGEGAGWQARFDERTWTAHRAWGAGIDLGPVGDAAEVERALRAFFARNTGLIGVSGDELRLRAAGYVERTDTWYVDFDRLVEGTPMWRAGVTARIKLGKLVMLGVDTWPQLRSVGRATVTDAAAIDLAERLGYAPGARHDGAKATPKVVAFEGEDGLAPRLVWEVRSITASPPGRWVSFVDARTGALLASWNEVRFFDGTVLGVHDTRTLDGETSTSAMRLVQIQSDESSAFAGDDGSFSLSDDESWVTSLRGSWLTVQNAAGAEGSLVIDDGSPTWTTDDATQAEIDSYVFLHQVRDWSLLIAPEVSAGTDDLRSTVNLSETCNAYWDGSVNFYEAGDGCNNTGRIADVNYHEWGHGFHYYSLEAGEFDGSISEGIGDVVAFLQTLDSTIAPYFMTNGSGIRSVAPDYAYPDDVTGEVHQDGLIFAGAVWDLYVELLDTYGESSDEKGTAWRVASTLFADAIKAGPTIPDSYDEFVVADDDDGDLSNGTPHRCEIVAAFGMHGLGPGSGGTALQLLHDAIGNLEAGTQAEVSGTIENLVPECADFELSTIDVVYSLDGSMWDSVPLDSDGDGFWGNLPAFEAGSVVHYYLAADTVEGESLSLPSGGSIAPYTFYVGELTELYCEDFSTDDGGYLHELLDGTEQEGADDWIFGEPGGLAGDPTEGWSGTEVWGNDHGGGRYNGEYQPNIVNRLSTVSIDVGEHRDLVVQYRRWLNVEDGVYDSARLYANDEELWTNHETSRDEGDEHTEDAEWMLHTLRAKVDAANLVLAWEIESDEGLEFGGWNIDDVCVYAPVAAASDDVPTDEAVPDDDGGLAIQGGCGCGAPAAPGAVAAMLAALALARRRRR